MTDRAGPARRLLRLWIPALALTLGACAPVPQGPKPLDTAALSSRYERQRAAREQRLTASRSDATAWIDAASFGRLPALQLDVALANPDQVRARVASLFGTALDLRVSGDSLTAWVPPRKLGFELDSLEDSLGIRRPGEWACRALGATWRPEGARWMRLPGDSLAHAVWIEAGDSLSMSVDSRALPVEVELRNRSGRALRIRYPSWSASESVAWPSRLEIEDGDGAFRIALRIDRVRFESRLDPRWMALTLPPTAERLDWTSLRETIARLGVKR